MKIRKLFLAPFALILAFAFVMLLFQTASAGCCDTRPFAGGTATSINGNVTISSLIWRAEVSSWQDGGPALDKIGWTSWHVYEKCGGATIDYTERSPAYAQNTTYRANVYEQAFNSCSLSKVTGNKGYHQYEEAGYTSIYPWVHYTKSFP